MKITITIYTDNAAFYEESSYYETGRILAKLANEIKEDHNMNDRKLRDINGNPCGEMVTIAQ